MKTCRKIVSFAVAVLMAVTCLTGLTACGSKDAWPTDKDGMTELLIGGIGPTTGGYSNYGLSVQHGAEIAVRKINEMGGVNGFKFVLEFEDSQADPASAVAAYGKLMDNGMKVSLGAVLSGETASVVKEAEADKILVLTPSASSMAAIAGNDCAFRVCFNDPYQGVAAAQYVTRYNLGTKVAVFYGSDNDYCVGLYENFKAECEKSGVEIVSVQTFTADTSTDFSTQINAIKASGADLVFLPIYAEEASSFLTQAAGKLDGVRCFGCDGLDGLLGKLGNNTANAEGVLMLTPFTADDTGSATAEFVSAYKAAYGAVPDQFAADAYDAVFAIAEALKTAKLTSEDKDDFNTRIVGAMTKIKVSGLTGEMSWTKDGEVAKDAKLMEFKGGKVVAYTK